jgi:hypothetical protein
MSLDFVRSLMDDTTREVPKGDTYSQISAGLAPAVGQAANAIFSSADAFKTHLLMQGAATLEAGLEELRQVGASEQEIAMFKAVDPSNREALQKALEGMARLKRARTAEMQGQKLVGDVDAQADKELRELQDIETEKARISGGTTPAFDSEAARRNIRQRLLSGIASKAAGMETDTMLNVADRLKMIPGGGAERDKPLQRAEISAWGRAAKALNEGKAAEVNLAHAAEAIKRIQTGGEYAPLSSEDLGSWMAELKAQRQIDTVESILRRLPANKWDKLDEGTAGAIEKLVVDWQRKGLAAIESIAAAKLSPEKKAAARQMTTVLGEFMADFIKSKSGAAVTDNEREFLQGVLNIGNHATGRDMMRSLQQLADKSYRSMEMDLQQAELEVSFDDALLQRLRDRLAASQGMLPQQVFFDPEWFPETPKMGREPADRADALLSEMGQLRGVKAQKEWFGQQSESDQALILASSAGEDIKKDFDMAEPGLQGAARKVDETAAKIKTMTAAAWKALPREEAKRLLAEARKIGLYKELLAKAKGE